mgnify:CR=1 FL=1
MSLSPFLKGNNEIESLKILKESLRRKKNVKSTQKYIRDKMYSNQFICYYSPRYFSLFDLQKDGVPPRNANLTVDIFNCNLSASKTWSERRKMWKKMLVSCSLYSLIYLEPITRKPLRVFLINCMAVKDKSLSFYSATF